MNYELCCHELRQSLRQSPPTLPPAHSPTPPPAHACTPPPAHACTLLPYHILSHTPCPPAPQSDPCAQVTAAIVLAGLFSSLSIFGQYWKILSGEEEYQDGAEAALLGNLYCEPQAQQLTGRASLNLPFITPMQAIHADMFAGQAEAGRGVEV